MTKRKGDNPFLFNGDNFMIVMTKETDAKRVQEICEAEGIGYSEDIKLFTAKDKDEILGYSMYTLTDKLYVINIATPQMLWNSIGDGLFKGTLNLAIENGVNTAKIEKSLLEKLSGNIIPAEKAREEIDDCEEFLQSIKKCGR